MMGEGKNNEIICLNNNICVQGSAWTRNAIIIPVFSWRDALALSSSRDDEGIEVSIQ
jgi:hypothetical protein